MAITFTGRWADIDADLAGILADANQSFSFAGTDYACVINRGNRSSTIMEGGEWAEYTGKVTTRRALFDAVPEQGDEIVIAGVTYEIGHVVSDDGNPVLEIFYQNNPAPR
jgi:hypothetical protein